MRRNFRKPLIVMTPKSLLRHKNAVSPIAELAGGAFQEVLDDAQADPARVKRLLLCSGKVYYDLMEQRPREELPVAIVRVEQFYPFATEKIQRVLKKYGKARDVVWVQEESMNMGGWTFMEPRLRSLGAKPLYVGRDASASPATGSRQVHLREQKELVEAALSGSAPHLVRSLPTTQARRLESWDGVIPAEAGDVELDKALG
jgi:2-oxoglutarate dehydrogenase E1 component